MSLAASTPPLPRVSFRGIEFRALLSRSLILACLFLSLCVPVIAQRLSPLAPAPDWKELEEFQETITRAEFASLLDTVYAPDDAARGLITVGETAAIIRTSLRPAAEVQIRFAANAASATPPPRYWRPAGTLGVAPAGKPLDGVKIALDPGHLGGDWAKMEERWFQVGSSKPVAEGEMTLRVAQLLAPQLRALGAEVSFVREKLGPTSPNRPETLHAEARAELALQGIANPRVNYDPAQKDDPARGQTVQWQSELLFYRIGEIRHRAKLVNETIQPDLVLCIHFNAEGWGGEPLNPEMVPRNHLHLLVNGCYSAGELRFDDQRYDFLLKLLNRSHAEELAASEVVARALATAANLPAYRYTTPNARPVGTTPFVWARNLLANRLYRAPVVFLEPYVMNSEEVWSRVQAGEYKGKRVVAGVRRKDLFREYADAVAAGLAEYYRKAR
jgi:N-acetylmuramoyl-L-alanine amidase